MATFVSTTLTKRTGAVSTVFSPSGINNAVGYLRAPSTFVLAGQYISVKQEASPNIRRTSVRVAIPGQPDVNGVPTKTAWGQFDLFVPAGTLVTDVNDIVGFMNGLTAASLANFNDILVNGVGLY